MKVMKTINELNVNQKVGTILIRNRNQNNEEIIRIMINSYHNVYHILVCDYNNSVDNSIHDLIKQLVRQSTLMRFSLLLDFGKLKHSNEGL